VAFDPDYAKVALLLHMDGANGSTTFTDSSAAPKAVTAAPSTAITTESPRFGTGAASIGGASGYIQAQGQSFGTDDFTVEFLAYISAGYATLLDNRVVTPSSDLVIYDTNGANNFALYAAGANRLIAPSVASNSWVHFAVCRASGITRFFLNGVQNGGTYSDTNNYNHTTLRFGNNFVGNAGLNGKLDEVRVTPGIARYTANFTPPTAPFPDTATAPALSAYAAAPTPLGAPATLAASIRQAWIYAASPLGAPAILAARGETFFARAAAATPLGAPLALARAVGAARVATAGPLGAGAALGQLVAVARAAASGPLGAPASLARTMVYAQASVPSPLGDPAVRANQPHVFARAQGFNSTAFGTTSFATRLQAAGFNSTAFGVPSSPVPQTVVASGFSKTYFGWAFGFQYIQPKINHVVSASPLATTQFGLPSSFIDVTVQATGSTSGQFGAPTAKIWLGAQAVAPATSWGVPSLLLSMRAQGFRSTSFGVPHAAMVLHAASTYRSTRWGVPTCLRSNTYLARSIGGISRFGRPTARKINAYQASSTAPSGQIGMPSCAMSYRALGMHGGGRFGKPLLIRNAGC
jgi:hypothetical protein